MPTKTKLLLILGVGAVWGAAEIFGGHLLDDLGLHGTSIWLAVWAVLLLSLARGAWNRTGSSALIGLVATGVRLAGPTTSACHLLGIAAIGLIFDLFASSLASRPTARWWRHALVGALTAYGARAFFVAYSVYVAQFERWVEGGATMAADHILRGGSVAAAATLLLAPLGFVIGRRLTAPDGELPAQVTATAAKHPHPGSG